MHLFIPACNAFSITDLVPSTLVSCTRPFGSPFTDINAAQWITVSQPCIKEASEPGCRRSPFTISTGKSLHERVSSSLINAFTGIFLLQSSCSNAAPRWPEAPVRATFMLLMIEKGS